jgi:enoyl-CoA hydratase/3-hydroxyacyl-CoA dehydrogenase
MDISDIKTIAVLGAGDMGHGIAEVALIAGYKVYLRDIKQEFVDKGVSRILESLEKLVSKGKVAADHFDKIKSELLVSCTEIKDAVEHADLVIEAIPEIMALKKETFEQVEAFAPEHAILASNTSTMQISEMAAVVKRPGKFLGLHYFNPAVLMKLVEVIRGDKTSDETMQIGYDFVLKNSKVPVRVEKDSPGFIVNRVQAPAGVLLGGILDKEIADPEEIDAAMRKMGSPMGPFEVMDFTGLDINVNGSDYFAKAIHPDFKVGKTISQLVKAGNLGKKSGKGIFDWSNGRPNIDLEKASTTFDFMDLIAVNANEATKIVGEGVCSLEDVDTAIINATGNAFGLIAMIKGVEPADLTTRLEKLADKFDKEIFKPTKMIKNGEYR